MGVHRHAQAPGRERRARVPDPDLARAVVVVRQDLEPHVVGLAGARDELDVVDAVHVVLGDRHRGGAGRHRQCEDEGERGEQGAGDHAIQDAGGRSPLPCGR